MGQAGTRVLRVGKNVAPGQRVLGHRGTGSRWCDGELAGATQPAPRWHFGGDRSVAKLESNDKVAKRLERWNSIIRSSAEQSGRAMLPPISWHSNLRDVVHHVHHPFLILHEEADTPLRSVIKSHVSTTSGFALIVGPEGGLSPAEVATCRSQGGTAISLGPRILRTETAALAAIAQLSFAIENERD